MHTECVAIVKRAVLTRVDPLSRTTSPDLVGNLGCSWLPYHAAESVTWSFGDPLTMWL
jgi:hypothetical protein